MTVGGVHVLENGQVAYSGDVAAYLDAFDAAVARRAIDMGATTINVPPILHAEDLERCAYFSEFPHVVGLAVFPSDDGVGQLADGASIDEARLGQTAGVLPTAACLGLYPLLGNSEVEPSLFTTRAMCFRREEEFQPLKRHWAFSMREIVYVGTKDGAIEIFEGATRLCTEIADMFGIAVSWRRASDPFFGGDRNPKALMQRVDPTKFEMVDGTGVAIASRNLHHEHFGRSHHIRLPDGGVASSACIAFGIDRWIGALFETHGPDVKKWPTLQ